MKVCGAGLALGISSILILVIIASCVSSKPRDRSLAAPGPRRAPDLPAGPTVDPRRESGVPARPSLRPAPKAPPASSAGRAEDPRAKADALFEEERWLEAGQAYMDVLASFPEHPEAEAILERALGAYEWIESERQIAVLDEIFRRFPGKRTPARAFDHAVLMGEHGDHLAAIPRAEAVLKDLPDDAFRVYALRRVAGLHRAAGDRGREDLFLQESRALAAALGDARTVAEIDGVLAGSAVTR